MHTLRNTLLTLALTVPLLALGGVSPATLVIAASCVVCLAFAEALSRRSRVRSTTARLVVGLAWAHAGFCALQLVPLPDALLRLVSPQSAAIWASVDATFGRAARHHPVTLDPPGTAFALATALTTAAFLHVVTLIASDRAGRERIARACIYAIVVFGAVGVLARIWDHGVAFGLYTPRHALATDLPITLTLLNPNHAAAAAAIAPPLLFGFAVEREALGARMLAGVGVIATGAIVVLTLSRGGIGVLVFELVAMSVYAASWRQQGRKAPLALGLGALVAAVATAFMVAGDSLVHEAGDRDLSKLDLIRRGGQLALEHARFGVGRGAFASAFAAYEAPSAAGLVRFSHPENLPIELASELGLPVAACLLAGLAYVLARSTRDSLRRPVYAGALVALMGLGIHEQFDFATEFAGVGLLAAALFAIVASAPPTREGRTSVRAPALSDRAFGIATPLLGLILLRPQWRTSLDEDQANVSAAWREGRLSTVVAQVDDAATRHPADPYLALAAGVARLPQASAGAHVIRAVKLAPYRAITHLWVARTLLAAGRSPQAWGEYREALRLSEKMADAVLTDVVGFGAPVEEIQTMTTNEARLELAVKRLVAASRAADAVLLDRDFIARFPPAALARLRESHRAADAGDVPRALREVRALRDLDPSEGRAYLLEAKLITDPIEAESELEKGIARCPDDVDLREGLLHRRGVRLGLEGLTQLADETRDLTLRHGLPMGRFLALLGSIELARKHPAKALDRYLDATATYPTAWAAVEAIAAAAESTGAWSVANLAWSRLATAFPMERRYSDAAARAHLSLSRAVTVPSATP